jgi:hypothetical protein
VIIRVHRQLAAEGRSDDWQERLEITSFTFMLNCVPLPVIQTWNMSACRPSSSSSHTRTIRRHFSSSSLGAFAGRWQPTARSSSDIVDLQNSRRVGANPAACFRVLFEIDSIAWDD